MIFAIITDNEIAGTANTPEAANEMARIMSTESWKRGATFEEVKVIYLPKLAVRTVWSRGKLVQL